MCGISGFYRRTPLQITNVANMVIDSSERGRDAWGIMARRPGIMFNRLSGLGKPDNLFTGQEAEAFFAEPYTVAVANNRAEPTTEFVQDKTLDSVQPYTYGNVVVVHNGTIANDKELAELLRIDRPPIDSMVIAPLVFRYGFLDAVKLLKGSFAIAAIVRGEDLWLACNYKPIFYTNAGESFYFASLPEYLPGSTTAVQMKPYTAMHVNTGNRYELLLPKDTNKVLVICSGGLDSTVVASYYVREGFDVTLLHFTYGCKAEKKEMESLHAIADHLGCEHVILDMSGVLGGKIGGSPLTDPHGKINKDNDGETGAEYAYEWVPARNLIFYSLALAYAEAHHFGVIALGNNLEEAGAYPDNEMVFARKFNELIPFAVQEGKGYIRIEQPVGNLMKHEIVKMGMDIQAPLHLTWSCYEAGDAHCGRCGPCYMRRRAFAMNDYKEVIGYAT